MTIDILKWKRVRGASGGVVGDIAVDVNNVHCRDVHGERFLMLSSWRGVRHAITMAKESVLTNARRRIKG